MHLHRIANVLSEVTQHSVMANLRTVVEAYCAVQRLSARADILKRTTKDQRITMPLRELMSFVEIRDESLLADYEVFLRKNPATASFVNLVGMTYDNHPKLADRRFNFYLTARRDDIKRILASLNYECPSPTIVEVQMETPQVLKRPRETKKESYSPTTLAKYSTAIEKGIMLLSKSELPSANIALRNTVSKHR
jgi:hypothetical protein